MQWVEGRDGAERLVGASWGRLGGLLGAFWAPKRPPRGSKKTLKSIQRVFPKNSMILRPSKWLAVAACRRQEGDVPWPAGPPDPPKCKFSCSKTSIFTKSLFCIQRWLGSYLKTSFRRFGTTPKQPGRVSPLIWLPPMRRGAEESHTVSERQNEANRSQIVFTNDLFSGGAEGCFPRIA